MSRKFRGRATRKGQQVQDRSRSLWPLVAAAAIVAIAGVAAAIIVRGNGSTSSPSSTVAVAAQTASTSATTATAPKPKVVHQTTTVVQQTKTVTQAASPTPDPARSVIPTGLTACDQNISVNSNTSCPFADNVFNEYSIDAQQEGAGSYEVDAYSPATGQTYNDSCQLDSETQIVDCSHGSDLVQFPEWAAAVYQTH